MKKRVRALGILITGIGLGSLRDFLFINLNYQIDHVQRATTTSFAHSRFQAWVEGHDLISLLQLKWILAALFIVAMWALSLLLLRNAGGHFVACSAPLRRCFWGSRPWRRCCTCWRVGSPLVRPP
jgi:hypothetical protein